MENPTKRRLTSAWVNPHMQHTKRIVAVAEGSIFFCGHSVNISMYNMLFVLCKSMQKLRSYFFSKLTQLMARHNGVG